MFSKMIIWQPNQSSRISYILLKQISDVLRPKKDLDKTGFNLFWCSHTHGRHVVKTSIYIAGQVCLWQISGTMDRPFVSVDTGSSLSLGNMVEADLTLDYESNQDETAVLFSILISRTCTMNRFTGLSYYNPS